MLFLKIILNLSKMNQILVPVLVSIFSLGFSSCSLNSKASSSDLDKPKLVVSIVVDQMRFDNLDKYNGSYSDNGFKRLIREGFNLKNNHFAMFFATSAMSCYIRKPIIFQHPSKNNSQINTPTWVDFRTSLAPFWEGFRGLRWSQDGTKSLQKSIQKSIKQMIYL